VKILIDANLSWRLIRFFDKHGIEAAHVNRLQGAPLCDNDIWLHAKRHGYVILTQDLDYSSLVETDASGPSVISLRTGNLSNSKVELLLATCFAQAAHAISHGERLYEIE
jgi:predicted nuclease of predicted toxin-antitoxin system